MTKYFSTFIFIVSLSLSLTAQVGINTASPNASAALDVTSTDKGLLIPRVTSTSNVTAPTAGMMVYQTGGTAGFYFYGSTGWTMVGGSSGDNLGNHTATQNLIMSGNSITGANNITATGTATLGGNAYPTTTGTSGQVLKTNGAGTLSWGSSAGATLELVAAVTTAQTFAIVSSVAGSTTPQVVVFDTPTTSPTIGTYDAASNTYTVGQNGLYYIEAFIKTAPIGNSAIAAVPIIQIGSTDNDADDIYGISNIYNVNAQNPHKARGWAQAIRYLTTGTVVKIRAMNSSNVITVNPAADGSSRLTIVKM